MEFQAGDPIYAIVAYDDAYVQPLIVAALKALIPESRLRLLSVEKTPDDDVSLATLLPSPGGKMLQIAAYEQIDFGHAAAHPRTTLVNSYVIRKALIRKHFLSATVDHWLAKHPDSVLGRHVRRSEAFEVDYAEFLDDALVEAFDLRASLERNEGAGSGAAWREEDKGEKEEEDKDSPRPQQYDDGDGSDGSDGADSAGEGGLLPAAAREWWILKPGMSDRGQGIRLFSTMAELQAIFDGWEADQPDSDDEAHDEGVEGVAGAAHPTWQATDAAAGDGGGAEPGHDYITTSHLRHFVAQPYVHPPLLHGGRKFHVRTYVVCVGALRVYVFREMLALFAAAPYRPPWETTDLAAHLTNTCLQGEGAKEDSVRRFWDLGALGGGGGGSSSSSSTAGRAPGGEISKEDIFASVCAVTGDVFEAAARGMVVHFQPLAHAFEAFGLDFLVDGAGTPWLLEVNAFPDFRQTGGGLRAVVAEFWAGALRLAVGPFAGLPEEADAGGGDAAAMVLVREVDLGRR